MGQPLTVNGFPLAQPQTDAWLADNAPPAWNPDPPPEPQPRPAGPVMPVPDPGPELARVVPPPPSIDWWLRP